jgi:hypothetical protein
MWQPVVEPTLHTNLLPFLSPGQKNTMPSRLPRHLTRAAALTLGGGLVASCALFVGIGKLEYRNLALSFAQSADVRIAAVSQGLKAQSHAATGEATDLVRARELVRAGRRLA